MYSVQDIKKMIGSVSDDKVINAVSMGALKLSIEQIDTVSFVFWLCYLAEQDIEASIKKPWEFLCGMFPADVVKKAKDVLSDVVFDRKVDDLSLGDILSTLPDETAGKIKKLIADKYKEKPEIDIDNIPYFSDKIRLYQGVFSENNVAKILWKINSIRNDLSHGRISDLKYEGESLSLRATKEKILIDYLEAMNNPDHSKSELIEKLELTPEVDIEVKRLFQQL